MVELSFFGTLGTFSVIILFHILARLSERLGSVEKMAPLYRYYYLALLVWAIGSVTHLLMVRANLTPKDFPSWLFSAWFLLVAYYLPLAIGATISVYVTWQYWSWLVGEPRR